MEKKLFRPFDSQKSETNKDPQQAADAAFAHSRIRELTSDEMDKVNGGANYMPLSPKIIEGK